MPSDFIDCIAQSERKSLVLGGALSLYFPSLPCSDGDEIF
jgi:hypothetical protein